MGDRGNIVIKQHDGQVWLYTHWQGSEIKEVAHRALGSDEGRARWTDAQYLARIVFCEMIKGDPAGESHGITTSIHDNEHDILVIDVPRQEVYTLPESQLDGRRVPDNLPRVVGRCWSFKAFVELKDLAAMQLE